MIKNYKQSGLLMLGISVVLMVILTVIYSRMWKDDYIIPGPGVTEVRWLSEFNPNLKGTFGDTRVYILDSGVPGPAMLVMGGTHADEPGGWMTTMVLIEHATVEAGKLIVIPRANNNGFTHNYPQEAHAAFVSIPMPDGNSRVYRHGSRTGNSTEHWPDPEVFIQYPSGQKLSGEEVRNLNRSWPGRPNGTFTEGITYGIRQLALDQGVTIQVDLHEGQPEYPFVNAISAHERALDLASMVSIYMQMDGLDIGVELSPDEFRGLSNLEMGKIMNEVYGIEYMAFTSETVNAEQGKIRGITDALLPIQGQDAFYIAASNIPSLKTVPYDEIGWPVERRIGRNLTMLRAILQAYNDFYGSELILGNIPTYEEIVAQGVGTYLNPLPGGKQPDLGFRALPGFWRYISANWEYKY